MAMSYFQIWTLTNSLKSLVKTISGKYKEYSYWDGWNFLRIQWENMGINMKMKLNILHQAERFQIIII